MYANDGKRAVRIALRWWNQPDDDSQHRCRAGCRLVLLAAFRKRSLIPGKMQTLGETILGFVRDEIAIGIIGPKHGLTYFPYLASIFFFILVGNLMEVFPLTLFPITSRIGLPIFLALITWFLFIFAGVREQGFGGYFGHLVWPPLCRPRSSRWSA
jgi:F0F1-type ATP synthase membrane subunit a